MYGYERVIIWFGIVAGIIFSIKWVYKNAFSHYEFKTKVIMSVVGIAIIVFMILANTVWDDVI